jgi:hypothetical protein
VIGTIDIDASDPLLDHADALVRAAFDASLGRALTVHEPRSSYQPGKRKTSKRRG